MSDPKRLHPIAAVVNAIKQLKEMIIPFLIFIVFGSRGTNWDLFYFYGSAFVVVLIFIIGMISWYRFTYRIEQGELRIEYGLLIRKKRYIPFERIQSLDFSEGILQRLFGLVKVEVETAASGGMGIHDGEAVLTAISKREAEFIHKHLVAAKKNTNTEIIEEESVLPDQVLYKITNLELLWLASTSGGVGVVISAVMAFLFQFEEFIPYKKVFDGVENLARNGVIFVSLLVFVGFLLAWMIALISTMIKYANFTVRKVDQDLIITRGMLEKRQFTIPLNRIQAVRISENLLRQPLGLATVYIESAGGSKLNEESSKVLLLPIVRKSRIAELIEPHLREYKLNSNIIPAPSRAYKRYLWKSWVLTVPVVGVASWLWHPWGYFSMLLLVGTAFWSFMNYKDAGWEINEGLLTLRYRNLVRHTVYMRKNKIQSFSIIQSYFQRKKNLASIEALVKSGQTGSGGKVIHLEKLDADRIYRWYSHEFIEEE